jgi:hypothetical protein
MYERIDKRIPFLSSQIEVEDINCFQKDFTIEKEEYKSIHHHLIDNYDAFSALGERT